MNTKSKSTLVLIGVLLIGIIIGAFGSSLIRRNIWEDKVAKFRSPKGFTDRLVTVIQPNSQQEKVIQEILLKHHEKMVTITKHSRQRIKVHADSLISDLEPVLTSEQLERAKRILRRGPRHFGPRKDRIEKNKDQ